MVDHKHFIGRSEIELLSLTIGFQLISLVTLLRVATGVAAENSTSSNNSSSPVLVVPSSLGQNVSIPNSTPQFVSPVGSGFDASLVLALIFVATNIVVIGFLAYLYRRKKMRWFSLLISLFLMFNVTELYFSFIAGLYSTIPLIAGLAVLAITLFGAFRGSGLVINGMALVLALELGSSFPVLLQAPLNWLIPLVYAVFDIYAVYFGNLGKLVRQVSTKTEDGKIEPIQKKSGDNLGVPTKEKSQQQKKKRGFARWPDFGLLSIRLYDIEIGMADIAFYTMVPAVALVLNSLFAFVIVMIAVDVGVLFSFTIFKRSEVAPGLPIPILSGLAALLVVSLVA